RLRLAPVALELVGVGRDSAAEHLVDLAVGAPTLGWVGHARRHAVALLAEVGVACLVELLATVGELLLDDLEQVHGVFGPLHGLDRGAAVVVVPAEAGQYLVDVDVAVSGHQQDRRLDVLVEAVRAVEAPYGTQSGGVVDGRGHVERCLALEPAHDHAGGVETVGVGTVLRQHLARGVDHASTAPDDPHVAAAGQGGDTARDEPGV